MGSAMSKTMQYIYRQLTANTVATPSIQPQRLPIARPDDKVHVHYSVAAYQTNDEESLKEILLDGWELVKNNKISNPYQVKKGYFGVAYVNEQQKHVIIAHRGTEVGMPVVGKGLRDLMVDLDTATRHMNVQEPAAWIDFAKNIIMDKGPNYTYSFAGHSLGGWLAQVCLLKYQDEFVKQKGSKYIDGFAVTLDEPGAKEVLEALQPVVATTHKIDVEKLDITNYVAHPNIVNTLLTHVGSVYAIFRDLNLTTWQKHVTFTLKTHGSEELLQEFDTATEKKKKCIQVLDWPKVVLGEKLASTDAPCSCPH